MTIAEAFVTKLVRCQVGLLMIGGNMFGRNKNNDEIKFEYQVVERDTGRVVGRYPNKASANWESRTHPKKTYVVAVPV